MRGLTSLEQKNKHEDGHLAQGPNPAGGGKNSAGGSNSAGGVKNQMEGGKNSADRRLWVNLNTYVITAVVS